MYLMVDKEKGEVMEGEGSRTKEILQEHALPPPSDLHSQLGPLFQEINSVTKPESCSVTPYLDFAALGIKYSNIDLPRTFHIQNVWNWKTGEELRISPIRWPLWGPSSKDSPNFPVIALLLITE